MIPNMIVMHWIGLHADAFPPKACIEKEGSATEDRVVRGKINIRAGPVFLR